MHESVSLALDGDEALVFFELVHRMVDKDSTCLPAERAVLNILVAQMERVLSAPFARDYDSVVAAARSRVAEKWNAS